MLTFIQRQSNRTKKVKELGKKIQPQPADKVKIKNTKPFQKGLFEKSLISQYIFNS